MRASKYIVKTMRESPQDAVVASHKLMLRSGLVRKLGAGLYHFLPLGLRVFRKIENIIREEMNAAGAVEFRLPILTPSEVWKTSGRWDVMGKEMFRVKDRHEVWNVLGPTHEESFTDLMKGLIRSYRDLPLNVYQIHTKFRDEVRPRFGVIRGREFCMKDAYSFDRNPEEQDETYQAMRVAYRRIFARAGLRTLPVEADSGSMGGSGSEEFMVPSNIGEETLLISEHEKYRGNQEKTPVIYQGEPASAKPGSKVEDLEKIHTPDCKTIEEIAAFVKMEPTSIMKTVAFVADNESVLVCLRADRQVNEVKVKNHLDCNELFAATDARIREMGSEPGYIGPAGIKDDVRVLWDESTRYGSDYVIGANEKDQHFKGFNPPEDRENLDLAMAVTGDPSPGDDGPLKEIKGIEVGHIFKLGYKYSEAFNLEYMDENGKPAKPIMGSYGIGVERTIATIIEQHHDENGIQWPVTTAPFEVLLVGITKTPEEEAKVRELYDELVHHKIEVLWDDRDERPGVKFKDAELIGFPIRLTMGKHYFEKGELEVFLRYRNEKSSMKGTPAELSLQVLQTITTLRTKLYEEMGYENVDDQ